MKELFAVVGFALLCNAVSGQFTCCGPLLDYTGYTDLYLGAVDLNLLPGSPPDAYTGVARVTSKYSDQMMITEYIDWDDIGFDGLESIVGDYRFNPGRIYDVYKNGSCTYTDYENLFMTPPCVPSFWNYISTFYLGTDILVDRYGDDINNNYINVIQENCQPIAQFATRRNQPTEGLYRFNTEFYTNITLFTGQIELPEGCSPNSRHSEHHIKHMPLSSISLRKGDPGKALRETPELRKMVRDFKKSLRQNKIQENP